MNECMYACVYVCSYAVPKRVCIGIGYMYTYIHVCFQGAFMLKSSLAVF